MILQTNFSINGKEEILAKKANLIIFWRTSKANKHFIREIEEKYANEYWEYKSTTLNTKCDSRRPGTDSANFHKPSDKSKHGNEEEIKNNGNRREDVKIIVSKTSFSAHPPLPKGMKAINKNSRNAPEPTWKNRKVK